jgi:formyltetrahydrofolate deformylase
MSIDPRGGVRPEPRAGREYILTIACHNRPGIVYAVSGFLLRHLANITQSQQHDQPADGRFFMRVQFVVSDPAVTLARLDRDFATVAEMFGMTWRMYEAAAATRTLIMVSKAGHCLNDLLFRWQVGTLKIDVRAVVSNHTDRADLARSYGVEFHHIPVRREDPTESEDALLRLVDELDVELVVLARYMQILSDDVCKRLEGRAINIHHSFLPSFAGPRPYHQAHERGVKLIGATAHYVTADLDEGPIIEQDVARVDHSLGPEQLATVGQDVEAQVLARAVRWHADHRVLLDGDRTVVFQ